MAFQWWATWAFSGMALFPLSLLLVTVRQAALLRHTLPPCFCLTTALEAKRAH